MLWLYGNPLLPMMNTVFQSPYWELSSVRDTRFLPKTMVDVLFYPWEWAVNSQYSIVSEVPFRDIRIALAMSLGMFIWAKWGIYRYAGQRVTMAVPSSVRAVVIFGLVAYCIWLLLFGIYRYLLPLEMLSGLFVVLALGALLARPTIWTLAAVAAAVACMVTTVPLEWGHRPFGNRYVEVSAPTLPSDTLVVLVGDEPVSYLIPFMSPDIIWVGLLNNFLSPDQQNLLVRRERDLISSHKDHLMVLKSGTAPEVVSKVLAAFGLAAEDGNCKSIFTNLNDQPYKLCQVVGLRPDDDG
jgi:hypothetical protein